MESRHEPWGVARGAGDGMSGPTSGVSVLRFEEARSQTRDDHVARAEPLEIQRDGASLAVVMRTPGEDLELALGFLVTERVNERPGRGLGSPLRRAPDPESERT